MSSFKVFDEKSIQSLLDLPAVIRSVESAYKAKAENQAEVWPMIYRKLGQAADMDIRSGWMKNKKFFGCKILQWSGNNVTRKLNGGGKGNLECIGIDWISYRSGWRGGK